MESKIFLEENGRSRKTVSHFCKKMDPPYITHYNLDQLYHIDYIIEF